MQKDIHFNLTYAIARKVGVCAEDAARIAWADYFTDKLTRPKLHGIRTQCGLLNDWYDKTVQQDILIPFHFLPGDDEKNRWMVTPDSTRAKALIKAAKDELQFGIALHALQDTYSHQGFTGWEEKFNACYWFRYIPVPAPDVGHTDAGHSPDIVSAEWYDPRNDSHIRNWERAIQCAMATFRSLCDFSGYKICNWPDLALKLQPMFRMNYPDRKKALGELVGEDVSFKKISPQMQIQFEDRFVEAARRHLASFMGSIGRTILE